MPRRKNTPKTTTTTTEPVPVPSHTPATEPGGDFAFALPGKAIKVLLAHAHADRPGLTAVMVHPSGYGWSTDGHRLLLVGPGLPASGREMEGHSADYIPIAPSDIAVALKVAGARGIVEIARTAGEITIRAKEVRKIGKDEVVPVTVGEWTVTPAEISPPNVVQVVRSCDSRFGPNPPPATTTFAANPAYIVAAAEAVTSIGASSMRIYPGPEHIDPIVVCAQTPEVGRALALVMPLRF